MRLLGECPICGSARWKKFSSSPESVSTLHYAQVRCAVCGLIASEPQATQDETNSYYGNRYFEEHWPDPGAVFAANALAYAECELPLMESLWPGIARGEARVAAEIGCGYGVMMAAMRERGFRISGCDISTRALEFCRTRGLAVTRGRFPGLPIATGSCDLVLATHVVEHALDPSGFVAEASGLLRSGGRLIMVTEDADASQDFWERSLHRVAGHLPPFRTSTDHTFLFGKRQLTRLLRSAGLDDIAVRSFSRPPQPERPHWKLYKGLFRSIDRIRGTGDFLMAVAAKR